MQLLTRIALLAIRLYQRWISPTKGFSCAYRVHTGRSGCSELGYRAIRRYGLLGGADVLNVRLALCSDCHAERKAISSKRRAQLGSCDPPCDIPCDGKDARCLDGLCDCLDCVDCDWKKKTNDRPTRQQRRDHRQQVREQRTREKQREA
ncbi:membrane protein insertion efficiency factor YidD [Rubrivivax rivuli]|uniref:Membrane protein insertion efficiency factor YidD n=1 Tax=Rubrivivax rivuli TaxID=1862385 RepID=A0A437R8G3_9BURK|nr:membrane protein insertion efficiency factor YidD [Rubrivivax rivuli]